MFRSLWMLEERPSKASLNQLALWLENTLAASQILYGWIDERFPSRERWTINSQDYHAPAILLFNTEKSYPCELIETAPVSVSQCQMASSFQVLHYPTTPPHEVMNFSLQLCCFRFINNTPRDELIDYWLGKHASIACENQTTVAYTQNVVVSSCHNNLFDGWAEEGFPEDCIENPLRFFNAKDATTLKQNIHNITHSSSSFIAMDSIYVQHYSVMKLHNKGH